MSWQTIRIYTPQILAATIAALSMKPAAAARFLGVSDRTMRRYLRGQRDIPVSTALLLNCMIAHRLKPVVPKRSTR
jgi:plasmid maintenance system antidote protein VapI